MIVVTRDGLMALVEALKAIATASQQLTDDAIDLCVVRGEQEI